jgi:hypothetical protein
MTRQIGTLNTNLATQALIKIFRKQMPFQAIPPIDMTHTTISSVRQTVTTVLSRDILPLFVFTIT